MNADVYVGGAQVRLSDCLVFCRVLPVWAFLQAETASRHVSKRVRKNKSVEAVFDEKARRWVRRLAPRGVTSLTDATCDREFLTGFHKRKKQRQKVNATVASRWPSLAFSEGLTQATLCQVAQQQQEERARRERLQARKEARRVCLTSVPYTCSSSPCASQRRDKVKEVLQRYDSAQPGRVGDGLEHARPGPQHETQYPGGVTVTVEALDDGDDG